MIYPDNFEYKIGFVSVRKALTELCVSNAGTEYCERMSFSTSFEFVSRSVGEVFEMTRLFKAGEDLPIHNFRDLSRILSELMVDGNYLNVEALESLRKSLMAMSDINTFFAMHRHEDSVDFPMLDQAASGIATFNGAVKLIDSVLDPFGNVKDTASDELFNIRRQLSSLSGNVNSVMRRVMAKAVSEGLIDSDATPALRDGRLVLPVMPMNKRKINGIVHDESASGKTVYIEPAEVVEVNNRIRELQMEERREIKRILIAIASEIRPMASEMLTSSEAVGYLDFVHAKALYARRIDAKMPHITDKPELELYHACHPVLKQTLESVGKEIVPLNITLSHSDRILLISGPNAGGKSVCLKTVGVLQYMLQCGMLPTVYDNSHMGIFESIFIDIGDDQSIEDDLSTYSSHLRNMRVIIQNASAQSLILIDEFGGGTEPQIGGAIAQAILDKINRAEVWGVITTHYQNLKHFAENTSGLVNGSMLYDRQRMTPLFQLSIGHPGSSFAIEIARKIGLPADIIDEAGKIVGSDYINMDKYLLDIARDRRYWERKRHDIRQKEKKLEETLENYGNDADLLRQRRNEIISQAKMEAKSILDQSNAIIERTIMDIKQSQAERNATLEARKKLKTDRERLLADDSGESKLLRKAPRKATKPLKQKSDAEAIRPFAVDDVVKLDGDGVPGKIIELNGKKATVVFGQLKTVVDVKRLRHTMSKISSGANRQSSFVGESTSADSRARQLEFSQQIDVRGMRVDEAVQAITYYIDDAIQFNIQRIRILHGTGTGALRTVIRQYLDSVPEVKSYADEHVQFGGAGITVVNF